MEESKVAQLVFLTPASPLALGVVLFEELRLA
jgi:hypothetical protein